MPAAIEGAQARARWFSAGQQSRMAGYGSYGRVIDVLEQAVSRNAYIAGARFSAADAYIDAQVAWGVPFGTLPERDACKRGATKDYGLIPDPS